MTARHLVENSRAIFEGTQNTQLETLRNATKIVVGLTVVFVISYVPYHILWTYFFCRQAGTFFPVLTIFFFIRITIYSTHT